MPRWGLLVEQNLGYGGQRRVWSAHVMDHVNGTREEALEVLRERAGTFVPVHPHRPRRRRLYRAHDGFLLVLDGSVQSFHCRFTVVEQLLDSAAPPPRPAPDPAPEEAPPPPPPEPAHEEEPQRPAREPDAKDEPPPPVPAPVRRKSPSPPPPPPESPRAWDADVPEVPSWYGRRDLS